MVRAGAVPKPVRGGKKKNSTGRGYLVLTYVRVQ